MITITMSRESFRPAPLIPRTEHAHHKLIKTLTRTKGQKPASTEKKRQASSVSQLSPLASAHGDYYSANMVTQCCEHPLRESDLRQTP